MGGLGRSGSRFGRSWPSLGRFGGIQNRAFFMPWPKISSKKPFGSIFGGFCGDLDGFGVGFGRV